MESKRQTLIFFLSSYDKSGKYLQKDAPQRKIMYIPTSRSAKTETRTCPDMPFRQSGSHAIQVDTDKSNKNMCEKIKIALQTTSVYSFFSVGAVGSVCSFAAVGAIFGFFSIVSATSVASVASVNSVASIASVNSVLSVGCINGFLKNCLA